MSDSPYAARKNFAGRLQGAGAAVRARGGEGQCFRQEVGGEPTARRRLFIARRALLLLLIPIPSDPSAGT